MLGLSEVFLVRWSVSRILWLEPDSDTKILQAEPEKTERVLKNCYASTQEKVTPKYNV